MASLLAIINEQLYPLNKIIDRHTNDITFKDTISLIFHAVCFIKNDTSEKDHALWKKLYLEFEEQLSQQNLSRWEDIKISLDYNYGYVHVIPDSDVSISTKNILTLLFKLIYIENLKRSLLYKNKIFIKHKILWYNLNTNNYTYIKNISLTELFDLLKRYVEYYIGVYSNKSSIEHRLGKSILRQLNV